MEHLQGIVNRDKARLGSEELGVKEEREEVGKNYESLVRKMLKTIFLFLSH